MASNDFIEIKNNYPLLDTIINFGYSIKEGKSSSTWLRLKKDGDVILYNRPKDFYINEDESLKNAGDKHDVINFIKNRLNGHLDINTSKEAYLKTKQQLLTNSFTIASEKHIEKQSYISNKIEQKKIHNSSEFNCEPIVTYDYLIHDRQLSKSTIDANIFKGKIFNSYYQDFKTSGKSQMITNYAFGKYQGDKLVGLEVKYPVKGRGISLGLTEALFISNFDKDKPVGNIYISESGIDALSYYELQHRSHDFKANNDVLVSIGGTLSTSKLNALNALVSSVNLCDTSSLISITDNDAAGNVYDMRFFAHLYNQVSDYGIEVSKNKLFNTLYLNVKNNDAIFTNLQMVSKDYNYSVSTPTLGSYIVLKQDSKGIIELSLPKSIQVNSDIFKILSNLLLENKKLNLSLIIEKPPTGNDWNDHLKSYKKKTIEHSLNNTHKKIQSHGHKKTRLKSQL